MSERGLNRIVEESAECSTCGACPGEPCSDVYDMVVNPHDERVRAAGFDPKRVASGRHRAGRKP